MTLKTRIIICLAVFLVLISVLVYSELIVPPIDFPLNTIYTVEKGLSLNDLATDLTAKKIIRSPFWFKFFSFLDSGAKERVAGDYVLDKDENTISLAQRISSGDFRLVPIRITIPEGLNVSEISKLFASKFQNITSTTFVNLASSSEGYLFPDTYFFYPLDTSNELVQKLSDNFENRIKNRTTGRV